MWLNINMVASRFNPMAFYPNIAPPFISPVAGHPNGVVKGSRRAHHRHRSHGRWAKTQVHLHPGHALCRQRKYSNEKNDRDNLS